MSQYDIDLRAGSFGELGSLGPSSELIVVGTAEKSFANITKVDTCRNVLMTEMNPIESILV